MKKIISILMLAIIFMMGANIEAKKVAKKSSSGSSFNMKSLISKSINSAATIKTTMKGFGFTYQSSYSTIITDDFGDMDVEVLKFTKSGVSADVYLGVKIVLNFSNSSGANSFVSASKSAFGSALKKHGSLYIYLKNGYYWNMEQYGSTVTITCEENTDGGESY